MQALSRATSAITKQYGLLLRSSNKGNHCATFILPALIKFYSFKAKSIFSHENDNSCHIKFLTVLMACNVYAPRTYFLVNFSLLRRLPIIQFWTDAVCLSIFFTEGFQILLIMYRSFRQQIHAGSKCFLFHYNVNKCLPPMFVNLLSS